MRLNKIIIVYYYSNQQKHQKTLKWIYYERPASLDYKK